MLGAAGYEVIEANSGRGGLKAVAQHHPDLILMDINLPDIDGIEVAQKLKSDPQYAHIPIIALTANAMHGDRERFLNDGCDDYLAKPISRMELINLVSHHLEAK